MLTHTTATRRKFMGAGSAALALGVISVIPGVARAEQQARRGPLDSELVAIVNRPVSAHCDEVCECHGCVSARQQPFECAACGFDGSPEVFPCTCGQEQKDTIAYWQGVLDGTEELTHQPHQRPLSRRRIKSWLRRLTQEAPVTLCGSPQVQCAHMSRCCPVCGVPDGSEDEAFTVVGSGAAAATIIRDLRAALGARGLV